MSQLFNRAGMSSSTSGTGTVTLGSALGAVAVNTSSWLSFTAAGVTDQTVVSYLILDSNGGWEAGTGTFTAAGTTLSRTPKFSSNSNAAINLSGTEQVFVTALAADGGDVLGGTTFPMRGFDTPVNLGFTASSDGTLLTVNVVGNNGANPTPTNPVFIPFRDPTATAGDPIWRIVTSALSINTNSAGASLGSPTSKAFRLWVVAFDNSGTVVLGLINCSTATQIFPLVENLVASTTNMSGTANSAGVFYTPAGINLVGKSFRIIGFIEYNSTGLATPGTYTRVPDFMQLFGPGIKKPTDPVQYSTASTTSQTARATASFATALSGSISPSSAANPIRIDWTGSTGGSNGLNGGSIRIARGSTLVGQSQRLNNQGSGTVITAGAGFGIDLPNATGSTTYNIQIQGDGTNSAIFPGVNTAGDGGFMLMTEIMG
jgi:hypothetical protein